ncbi:hypothetical protein [Streptomyces alkaliterrae]|uniref:PH domain-containing protein n=1 Tax=Streptomyces alkaliterrae TaxID=2213162 RepID=A0A5P0YQZ3_9ACTN|nr:hypothetical protein [Streptomyces alkaliterrae]MBB1254327.1 hypothetical protein [Streptomyces alkaliterrae]MBB1260818.1 hypothetical protein [Streptomyces alkaliterrae]MQS02726.1 hypothetical protein [Streptomyces alkaliterrae]
MPMSFLTADDDLRDHAHPAEEPLPFEDRGRWRRPYRPGPWRVAGAALLLLLSAYLLVSALIIVLAGTLKGGAVCLAAAVVVIGCALRTLRVGIWVSSHGLRQVGLLWTRTLPWAQVASVRTVQQPVRWLGLPRGVQGQALVVRRHSGDALRVLLTDHSADFLSRPEAFDRAADVLEAWADEHRVPR